MAKENYKCTNCKWEGTELSKRTLGTVGRVLHEDKCPVCGDEVEVKEYVDEVGSKIENPSPKDKEELLDIGETPKVPFDKLLTGIKGIGKKTAADIVKTYPSLELLKKAIDEQDDLPFEKDTNKLLIASYGGL